jgi:hypothetical protein
MTTYTFRINCPRPSLDAQIVGEELERIQSVHGVIDPHVVVDESRPEDSALHECFEWQDEIAAEKWRVEQARALVRSVEIAEDSSGHVGIAFVNVQSAGGYVSAATLQARPDLYCEAHRVFRSRIEAAICQLRKLEQLSPAADRKRIRQDLATLELMLAA